ncbi:MAG: TrkH family potassium uptake protein [Bifidobacteriaceae bacterium]|jgi:Trk-type K+ transport system membrane component|nr:TrkH family potassium uptake protein [Bifidobacteriaceae bacterium]
MAVTAFVVMIGFVTALLMAPWATASGKSATLVDAFFTATSAVCVTGLTTVPTGEYWSSYGHAVILLGIKVGGMGIMTIGALFTLVIARRLRLTQRLLAASETRTGLGEVRTLVRSVAVWSTAIELIVAAFLVPRFLALGESAGAAVWHGVFYGIGAFNNAGFVPTQAGLAPFARDWLVLTPIVVGVFVGALGHPVLVGAFRTVRHPRRWALTTKLTVTASLGLLVLSTVVIAAQEWSNAATFGDLSGGTKVLDALFAATMTRSGGFATARAGDFYPETMLVAEVLMLIGGGPVSTAGGIKVTTFAVMLLAIRAEVRGDRDIEVFRRTIPATVLRVAVTVTAAAVSFILIGAVALLEITDAPVDRIMFEVISAFSTCGLSTGLAATLPAGGKLVLTVMMLVGRLGPITLASALALSNRRRVIRLPEERPIVG